jgi:hypothetical protein
MRGLLFLAALGLAAGLWIAVYFVVQAVLFR